jgi:hypothetical protein
MIISQGFGRTFQARIQFSKKYKIPKFNCAAFRAYGLVGLIGPVGLWLRLRKENETEKSDAVRIWNGAVALEIYRFIGGVQKGPRGTHEARHLPLWDILEDTNNSVYVRSSPWLGIL